jgi:maleamate amidohydrolase
MKPWDAVIPQHEQEAYRAAGFGRSSGLGKRPALLIIDVQYRTVGTPRRRRSWKPSGNFRPRAVK